MHTRPGKRAHLDQHAAVPSGMCCWFDAAGAHWQVDLMDGTAVTWCWGTPMNVASVAAVLKDAYSRDLARELAKL